MTTFGITVMLFVIFCMILHEEFQHWFTVAWRWWRRKYRPTRWTGEQQRLLIGLVRKER